MAPGSNRFIISHLLAGHADGDARVRSLANFSKSFDSVLADSVDTIAERGGSDTGRLVKVVNADPAELAAKYSQMPADTVIERAIPHFPAVAIAPAVSMATAAAAQTEALTGVAGAGSGAVLRLVVVGPNGPARGALVKMVFANAGGTTQAPPAVTGVDGSVSIPYDPFTWAPRLAWVEPGGGAWSVTVNSPANNQVIPVPPLPRNGPIGWWQLVAGGTAGDTTAGAGIRVGVIDMGCGPHPYLAHVTGVGAFIDANFTPGADAAHDVEHHGTHVTGIIAARPPDGSGDYAGIARGADVFVIRIFASGTASADQGDIISALDHLSGVENVDLINMSFAADPGAPFLRSEQDAVIVAMQRGALCICAAGNTNGGGIGQPASYQQSVAISGLGLTGTIPAGVAAAGWISNIQGNYGLFLGSFSAVGQGITATAPGTAIISTIPAHDANPAPYADLSGTSMAAPLATGALAALLGRDSTYQALPRNAQRALYARGALLGATMNVGLASQYQGAGLTRSRTG